MKFVVSTALPNASVNIGLLAFAPEILVCKVHHVVHSLLITTKMAAIETNRRVTTRETAEKLEIWNSTVQLNL